MANENKSGKSGVFALVIILIVVLGGIGYGLYSELPDVKNIADGFLAGVLPHTDRSETDSSETDSSETDSSETGSPDTDSSKPDTSKGSDVSESTASDAAGGTVRMDDALKARFARYKNGIVIASQGKIEFVDKKGDVKWSLALDISVPILNTNSSHIMVADKDGKNLYLLKNDNIVYKKTTDDTIRTAKLNQNSSVSISCDEQFYKGKITVYSSRGTEQFVWHSGTHYILDTAVSKSGKKLAAVILDEDNVSSTSVMLFDMSQNDPYTTVDAVNSIIMQVDYSGGEYLRAITDTGVLLIDPKGNVSNTYSFNGLTLERYSAENSDMALILSLGDNSSIVTLDKRLGSKAVGEFNYIPNFVHIYNNKCIYDKNKGIQVQTSSGKTSGEKNLDKDVKNALFFSDTNYILTLYSSGYEIVKLNGN